MTDEPNIIELTAGVVASYVGHNRIAATDLGNLIKTVYGALTGEGEASTPEAASVKLTAAQIRKSITPAAITSFEDGKPYKALKRHLTIRGLSPKAYREKWGLPNDYPMTAITYSEQRSRLAKALGLGRKAAEAAPEPVAPVEPPPAAAAAPKPPRAPRKPRNPKAIDPAKEEFT